MTEEAHTEEPHFGHSLNLDILGQIAEDGYFIAIRIMENSMIELHISNDKFYWSQPISFEMCDDDQVLRMLINRIMRKVSRGPRYIEDVIPEL